MPITSKNRSDMSDSCKFCCLHVRPANISHAFGCPLSPHWVSSECSALNILSRWSSNSAILASVLLDEELGHLGRIGCALCLGGSLIIVLHAPEDKVIQTVDEILNYAIQPGEYGIMKH